MDDNALLITFIEMLAGVKYYFQFENNQDWLSILFWRLPTPTSMMVLVGYTNGQSN